MAPGSKRGSKVGRNNSELRLGDLVLAKIKGYPAWPAKIGRPEDWKHAPDPKKYFVQFFGTKEIAFIAPADIQAFTNEAKSKVSARCQGKKVKYFAKAVKEICEEFEALQKKNLNGVRDKSLDLSSIHTADSLVNEVPGGDEGDKISKEGSEVKFEMNNSNRIDSIRLDLRDCSSDDKDHPLLPHLSSEKMNELSYPAKPVKKDSVNVSSYSPVNTEALHDGKVEAGSSNIRSKELTIRDKPKLGQGLKRKREATMRKNSGSQEHSRDGKQTNFVPCSNVAVFSMDGLVLGLAAVSRVDYKKLMKKKAGSDARANARKDAKGKDEKHHDKVIPKKRKNPLRGQEKGDSKACSPSKASKHINSSAKEPGHSNDEDGLPQAKRHCKEQDKTYTPSLQENEIGNLAAATQKNGLLRSDQGPSPMLQLPKKRRAVRLCDDKLPKTPVHGGIANKVSSIPRASDSKKQTVMRGTLLELPSQISSKAPKIVPQKKVAEGANRDFLTASDQSSSFLKQSNNEKRISTFSGEKKKTTLRADTLDRDESVPGSSDEKVASSGVRLDGDKYIKKHIPAEYKNSESNVSMKNLIAAAQERKRLDSLQNSSRKFSPGLEPPFQSSSTLQMDGLTLPSFDIDEFEERRVSSGHQAFGSTLSSSTDAVVARDAFEGMIETLSKTKESIGRATRHAIDCTKYGIANEIVDLLIRKLENELNPRRRVVMFFLVDSITQCSHGQKGIAGASYIPCVEAALPRLIAAVAPPGKSALENRRQCYKVLRLWLERKILPENAIRRQMDHIEAANDGDDKTSLLLPNRQSRTERSFDDPVLEMEGMLDEYGSNATFQLPGLMMSNMFDDEEEEEDGPNPLETLANEVAHASPSEQTPASRDNSNYTATPNERRHCILEDVDGELEMEDDSVHHKEKALLLNASTSAASKLELVSPEGSPQFPLDTPPETPPLPSSPHPLSLPPTLPPRYSPDLPLPPPPPPPPLPPAVSSQHRFYRPLHPPPYLSQPQVPPQIATVPQPRPSLPNSQPIPYPSPLPHEVSNMPNGTQLHATRIEPPVIGEVLSHQQASFLVPPPVSSAHESMVYTTSRPVEYGQGGSYAASQRRPSYTPVGVPFVHRPVRIEPPPQRAADHFTYLNAAPQHQHPPPYALPTIPNGPRRYVSDDQWRAQGNEGWISGARSGHFGTTQERPMGAAAANFHYPAANVHGVPMMPSRPDMSNYHWR